jgi:hypothetical protein
VPAKGSAWVPLTTKHACTYREAPLLG